jgi:hypothetical protein
MYFNHQNPDDREGRMEYQSIHTLDAHIDQLQSAGATITIIGDTPGGLPLAAHDPTGVAATVVSDGMFILPKPDPASTIGGSIAYVSQHFAPRLVAVTETPLGIQPALAHASLAQIEAYNRQYAAFGTAEPPCLVLPAAVQIQLTTRFMAAVCRQAARESPTQ